MSSVKVMRIWQFLSSKKYYWQWLALIVAVGFCLRVFQVNTNPPGYYWDEMAMLVDAKALLVTGRDMHGRSPYQVLFPSYGDYKQPVYIWLTTGTMAIFGQHDWVVRVPNLLAGVGTILVAAWLAYLVADELAVPAARFSLVTAGVVATAPWSILFSRSGFEGHLGQFLLGVAITTLVAHWKTKKVALKSIYLVAAIMAATVATYSYFSVRFVWPVVVVLVSAHYTSTKMGRWQQVGKKVGIGLATVLLVLVGYGLLLQPMFKAEFYDESNRFRLSTPSLFNRYDFALESNQYREWAGNQIWDRALFHRHLLLGQQLFDNIAQNMSLSFLFVSGDPNLRHGTGHHGLFLWPLVIPFGWGWYRLFAQKWPWALVILGWWLVALVPASVPLELPHALRSLNALLPLSLVIGLGAASLLTQLKPKVWLYGWLVLVALSGIQFWYEYQVVYPQRAALAWQADYVTLEKRVMAGELALDDPALPKDGRFYLWFMWYEPFTGAEFQDWPSQGFMFALPDVVAQAQALSEDQHE